MVTSLPTLARAASRAPQDAGGLLAALAGVPDPRRGGPRRHPLRFVLGVLVSALSCAGFETFAAVAQWAAAADRELLLSLGAAPDPLTGAVHAPSEATIRRMACGVDAQALEAAIAAWTAGQLPEPEPDAGPMPVAIDGKTVRGARSGDQPAPHLLGACTHDSSVMLAQRQIPGKTNEIPMVATLLDDLRAAGHDPDSMVFTLDALHTQHATARLLHDAGAGYLMCVKGNQPGLRAAVIDQLRTHQPVRFGERSRGHGRTEERILTVVPATGIDFAGAAQVFRIVRHTGGLDGQRTRKEVVHGITNLRSEHADAARLAALTRGHWSIENGVHYVRDVTYREDAHRARTGNAPAVLAALRNAVTTALRLAGAVNIAAARRAATLDPHTVIRMFTRPAKPDKGPL
ncbi:MAG TPA: ISAs1 family transposase [Micromonospora sp.]|nr:ISAs1 family transposase [Micromonospora sp.]